MPKYFEKFGGDFISFTINKYIYQMALPLVEESSILLKYSKSEKVEKVDEIEHPVFRTVLKKYNSKSIDISVSSDIPAGTGLGSSSGFTVGLIQLMKAYYGQSYNKKSLAEEACNIEINLLKEPIGIQDQYAIAYGGLNHFTLNKKGEVSVNNLMYNNELIEIIKKNLILVRIPGTRKASSILKSKDPISNSQRSIHEITKTILKNLPTNISGFGYYLDQIWKLKLKTNSMITNDKVNAMYQQITSLGAYGGKLIGAGGSGYLLMAADQDLIEHLLKQKDFISFKPELDEKGSKIIYDSRIL
jgi:D-glycero-alpha-D-manno-heptose-7-phosphate kinase